MTGIGGRGSNNSWKGFGSNDSGQGDSPGLANGWVGKNSTTDDVLSPYTEPGNQGCEEENDRTCNTNAYKVKCYSDCDKATCDSNDGCFWTTCLDSVQQTLDVLRNFLDNYCVDLDKIYGSGCSNGGMFLYELANRPESAVYFAGFAPQVGLPHYGYNRGPAVSAGNKFPIHHMGFWGSGDGIVPATEGESTGGCTVKCRSSEVRGWFYTTSDCTMEKWAMDLGLVHVDQNLTAYGISNYTTALTDCTLYYDSQSSAAVVAGCIFNGTFYPTYDRFALLPNSGYIQTIQAYFDPRMTLICVMNFLLVAILYRRPLV